MKKSKALRLAGFAGALCASGALLGTSISGTGAYFTDSHSGAINSSTGHVRVNTSDLTLNFTGLLPGEFKTQGIDYVADGTGNEDVWLVIPSNTALNGDGAHGLGRYGHFAVDSPAGSFTSYNLRSNSPNDGSTDCPTDVYGHGGSNAQADNLTDPPPPYCPVPTAILLGSDLQAGQGGHATITFGYTKLLKGAQDGGPAPVTTFTVVATQHGVAPNDVNNG